MYITPSSFPRLQRCLGSAALPQADEIREGMERGTAIHAHVERMATGATREESVREVPAQWRADAVAIDLDPEMLRNGAAEVAFAMDLERGTSREIGRGLSRAEAKALLRSGEIAMIADWVALVGNEAHVTDWKSGAAESLTPAPKNAQLLTYMAAAFLAYQSQGITAAHGALVRVDRDTPYWERTGQMDALDVEAHLESIRSLLRRAKEAKERYQATGEVPPLSVSVACDWCASRRFCPAQVGQIRDALLVAELPDIQKWSMTPEMAGRAYAKTVSALELLKRFKSDLEGLAKQEPLPLPDGRVLRWEVETEASVDVEKAAPLLARAYGGRVVELATKRAEPTMPWAKLSEALATEMLPTLQAEHAVKGRKPTRGSLVREARNMLEQNDAVRVSTCVVPRVMEERQERTMAESSNEG